MTTFVLVHGAWHGAWCWQRVRKRLQAGGHEVFTPSLTGVGERAHLCSPQNTLDTHVDDVVNLLRWENLRDVVLCGHSYGGCVITGVADRARARLRAIVYLDAFILENGQSLHDLLPPAVAGAQVESAEQTGAGWLVAPIPAAAFGVNAADRDWVDSQCTPQSINTFRQRLALRSEPPPPELLTHVLATAYEHSPFPPFHELAKRKGWKTRTIASGHDAMLDLPDEVVELLLDAAG